VISSSSCVDFVVTKIVGSGVVVVVDVLSVCLLGLPKPATATESFAVDFRFLASIGDSDLVKAPAVHNKRNALNCFSSIHFSYLHVYLTCSQNTQDNDTCDQTDAEYPAQLVRARLVAFVFRHVQFLTSANW
jgi:hypothetical protein